MEVRSSFRAPRLLDFIVNRWLQRRQGAGVREVDEPNTNPVRGRPEAESVLFRAVVSAAGCSS